MLSHKTSLGKLKKTEIISNIANQNGRKLEVSYKKKLEKNPTTQRLKQHATKQLMDQQRIKQKNLKNI